MMYERRYLLLLSIIHYYNTHVYVYDIICTHRGRPKKFRGLFGEVKSKKDTECKFREAIQNEMFFFFNIKSKQTKIQV